MEESRIQLKKRKLILQGAKQVFAEKGYAAATIQDIADYCDISRANVYAYYPSTFAILDAILREHSDSEWEEFLQMKQAQRPAWEILEAYFAMHKLVFSQPDHYLVNATIEWYWQWASRDIAVAQQQLRLLMDFLGQLIAYGVERGEFSPGPAEDRAEQMAYLLLGIRAMCPVLRPSSREIDHQFDLCRRLLR